MNFDPYKMLGVERNASPFEVKAAYRFMAQAFHPDKQDGDEEKFKNIKLAYEVLSDPDRRAHYDANGVDSEQKDGEAEALNMLAHLLRCSIEAAEDSVAPVDYVAQMRRVIDHKMQEALNTAANIDRTIARRIHEASRIRRKSDGPNLLAQIIEHDIAGLVTTAKSALRSKALYEQMRAKLEDYESPVPATTEVPPLRSKLWDWAAR